LKVENAIQIAWNPQSDPGLQQQAIEFVNHLRSDPQSWTVCLPLAIRKPPPADIVKHIAIDVVNNAIQGGILSETDLLSLKDSLMRYVQETYGTTQSPSTDPVNIQNKFVEGLTYLFTRLYADKWTTFFEDLLALTVLNPSPAPSQDTINGTKIYLKVIGSVHDEIADVLLSKSPEEKQRDTALKDLIRERDVQKITASWQTILSQFNGKDLYTTELCLSAIGKWASWIDLSLIINDSFLNLLFSYVMNGLSNTNEEITRLRDLSITTITEIISKKMRASDKLNLIEILKVGELVAGLTTSPVLQDMRFTSSYDTDFAEIVAKLVNSTIQDIVNILDSTPEADPVRERAHELLKAFVPYMLRFFSDEYDEICSSVIPCLTDLLTFFRKKVESNGDYRSMLPSILQAIMTKMKYDETSEWGSEDNQTDEAEFQELRKRLQVLQQQVAAVDEVLYMETISTLVVSCFDTFQANAGQVEWRDIDLAMHEMYLFGQIAVKNGNIFSKGKPISAAAEHLAAMMMKLVDTGKQVSNINNYLTS
jgi:exportin-T